MVIQYNNKVENVFDYKDIINIIHNELGDEVVEALEELTMEEYEELKSKINNNGCEFCNKEKKWCWEAWTEVRIEDGSLKTYAPEEDEIHVDEFKINYCPMCGRDL